VEDPVLTLLRKSRGAPATGPGAADSTLVLAPAGSQHQNFWECGPCTFSSVWPRTSMMVGAIAAFLAGLGRYFYRMPTSPP
jgi:hypothetical protein